MEAQDLFRGDFRIRFVCALGTSSRFPAGVESLLRQAGIDRTIPWADLKDERYDLVLAASENVDFATTSGPVVLLPHGVGFNKAWPSDGLAGLPASAGLRTSRIHLVLSHPEQEAQLRAAGAGSNLRTLVTGDTTFDRLVASTALRDRYRRELGTRDRQLVLVATTWGEESTLGRRHDLPRRLLAQLPHDSYSVCVVAHPNIWAEHGARHLAVYYADELDAGMLLLPPESGWHAALVAADHVITDHGSLALYAAALGKPLLLSEPSGETVPGSPVATLHALAGHLDGDGDLRAQLVANTSENDAVRLKPVTDRLFAHRGQATERLQRAVYELLGLEPLKPPALRRAPDPEPRFHRAPAAFRVRTERTAGGGICIDRRPASLGLPPDGDWHLAVEESESDLRLAEQASVLCRAFPATAGSAWSWASSTLDAYPFARLAAGSVGPGQCEVVVRDGRRALITSWGGHADVALLASAAYHCLLADSFTAAEFPVEFGTRCLSVRLEVSPDPTPPAAG